ncbi:hypothetical protein [Halopolyspora algeriensis]|nr:hypothetical protein [Halopolyspora algeriensis]
MSLSVCDPVEELSLVRTVSRTWLRGYSDSTVLDALLVLDNLFTDAIRSGRTPRHVWLGFNSEGRLELEIIATQPSRQIASLGPLLISGGLGRLMLEDLTHSWGVESDEHQQRMWAVLEMTSWSLGQ